MSRQVVIYYVTDVVIKTTSQLFQNKITPIIHFALMEELSAAMIYVIKIHKGILRQIGGIYEKIKTKRT